MFEDDEWLKTEPHHMAANIRVLRQAFTHLLFSLPPEATREAADEMRAWSRAIDSTPEDRKSDHHRDVAAAAWRMADELAVTCQEQGC